MDGEWDNEFPPLDHQEPVIKFSFSHLALITADGQGEQAKQIYYFTFLLPNAGNLRITLPDSETITIKQALDVVFQKSSWIKLTGSMADASGYYLEKLGNPSIAYKDLDSTISSTKCHDFCVVRRGAKSVQAARASDAAR